MTVYNGYRLFLQMLLISLLFSACSENPKPNKAPINIQEANRLFSRAEKLGSENCFDSSIYYYRLGINAATDIKNKKLRGEGYSGIADAFNSVGNCDSVMHFAQMAMDDLKSIGQLHDAYFLAATIQMHCYLLKGNYPPIIQSGLLYFDEAKAANDTGNMARVSTTLSEAYFAISDFEKTIKLRNQAVALLKNSQDKSLLKDIYTQLAVAYNENEQYDSAIIACYHALQSPQRTTSDDAYTYDFLADAYLGLRKNDSALRYLDLSKRATLEISDPINMLNILSSYVVYYNSTKQFSQAITATDSAFALSERHQIMALLPAFWKMRSTAFEGLNDFKNALIAERIADSLNRRNSGEEAQQKMVELDKKYQAADKENTIRHLTKEAQLNQKLTQSIATVLVVTMLFLIAGGWQYYRQRKAKRVIIHQAEKVQFLMKEIHHRVKNNLQVVSSLINLQLRSVHDPNVHDILVDTQTRIQSIGLIHQRLYQTGEIEQVNLHLYFTQLLESLKVVYQNPNQKAKYLLSIPAILLDLDTAIPLALVLTELVSNSFKHAKIECGNPIEISISIHAITDAFQLDYGDNGKPISDIVDKNENSVGLTIVKLMTKQMSGQFVQLNPARAIYKLTFKLKEQRKRNE
ncbi:MAG: sensor histidine kinase [Bacteroidetes bacterium]|nr:sensor histidine kinase [Bacteroidota bacterium]